MERLYWVYMLASRRNVVWYESYADVGEAIGREKNLKKWNRAWKLQLIESVNPTWRDLYEELNA